MENDKKDTEADNRNEEERGAEQDQENPVTGGEAEVQAAVEGVREDGESDIEKIEGEEGCMPDDIEEMRNVAGAAAEGAEKAGEQYLEEEKQENRLDAAKKFLDDNQETIIGVGDKILDELIKTGKVPNAETTDTELGTDLIALLKDGKLLEDLEKNGLLNPKMISALNLIIPVVERTIKFKREVEGNEKFAQAMKGLEEGTEEERSSKEVMQRVVLEIISSTDAEKDPARIAAAGMLLIKYSSKLTSPASLAVKALGASLQIPMVQNYLSKKFRNEIEKKKDEAKESGKSEEDIEKEAAAEIFTEMEF